MDQNKVEVVFTGNADALKRAQGDLDQWPKRYRDELRKIGDAYRELERPQANLAKHAPGAGGPQIAGAQQKLADQVWLTTRLGQQGANHERLTTQLQGLFGAIQNGTGSLAAFFTQVTGISTAFMGLGAVVQAATEEWNAYLSRERAASAAQSSDVEKMARLMQQIGGNSELTPKEIQARTHHWLKRGIDPYAAYGAAAGARHQGATVASALGAADATLEAYGLAGADIQKLMTLGAQRIAGKFGVSPEEALGFLAKAQSQSQISEEGGFEKYAPQAIYALKTIFPNISGREAAHLYNTINQQMGDPYGRTSRTATINWALQLREATPDKQGWTPLEILEWMQTTPEGKARSAAFAKRGQLKEDFLAAQMQGLRRSGVGDDILADVKSYHGEQLSIPAIENLHQMMVGDLRKLMDLLVDFGAEALAEFEKKQSELRGLVGYHSARLKQGGAGAEAALDLDQNLQGVRGQLMDNYRKQNEKEDMKWGRFEALDEAHFDAILSHARTAREAMQMALEQFAKEEYVATQGGYHHAATGWRTARQNLDAQLGLPHRELDKSMFRRNPGPGENRWDRLEVDRQKLWGPEPQAGAAAPAAAAPPVNAGAAHNAAGAAELQKQTSLLAAILGALDRMANGGEGGPALSAPLPAAAGVEAMG